MPTAVVEGCKGQDQVVDLGGSNTYGEALISVLRCRFRATSLLAEHARRDITVNVNGWFAVARGELQGFRD